MTNNTDDRTLRKAQFRLPFSYCGLLDDVVARYDDRFADPDLFNRLLVKSLFFGGGLYINDGYLFMHAAARRQMLNPNSVLCRMLEYGFARILTRTDKLEQLIGLIDNSTVPSHKEFAASSEWPALRKRWELICSTAWRGRKVTFWGDPRNHKIQAKLYERQLSRNPDELGLTCDRKVLERVRDQLFSTVNQAANDLNPYARQARTRYEIACQNAVVGSGLSHELQQQQLRELMRLGNECYHYAFGASLSWQQRTAVAVDTLMSSAFDKLIIRPQIDFRKLESMPSFGIPVHVDLTLGDRLIPLMDRTSTVFRAKVDFLQNLLDGNRLQETPNNDWINTANDTAEQYASALETLLPGTKTNDVLSGSRQSQLSLVPYATPDIGQTPLSVGVAAVVASAGTQSLTDSKTKLDLEDDGSRRHWKFAANEFLPQASTLAFHQSVVDEILNDPFLLNDAAVRESES